MARDPNNSSRPPVPVFPKGTKVRAHAGPFVGKIGEVQEVDAKGAKVSFGGMSAYVELADLVAVTDENLRPKMSSSHRRPGNK